MSRVLDANSTPHQFLTELRLNKCGIPEAGGMALFQALQNGNHVRPPMDTCAC